MTTADLVFGGCLLIGGGLLLLTLIFDDLFGGLLSAVHLGFDLGGVSPTPILLGFVAMFGVGENNHVLVTRQTALTQYHRLVVFEDSGGGVPA